jgi:hypothetical protein
MRNILLVIIFFFSFTISVLSKTNDIDCRSKQVENIGNSFDDPSIICVEYILIDGEWYLKIYYSDGTIGVVPAGKTPEE